MVTIYISEPNISLGYLSFHDTIMNIADDIIKEGYLLLQKPRNSSFLGQFSTGKFNLGIKYMYVDRWGFYTSGKFDFSRGSSIFSIGGVGSISSNTKYSAGLGYNSDKDWLALEVGIPFNVGQYIAIEIGGYRYILPSFVSDKSVYVNLGLGFKF
jgi:long-subunit fatty acid transport protein